MGYARPQQRSALLGLAPGLISFASLGPWSPRRCTCPRLWWEVGDGYSLLVLDLVGFYNRTPFLSDSLDPPLGRGFPVCPPWAFPATSFCAADFLSLPVVHTSGGASRSRSEFRRFLCPNPWSSGVLPLCGGLVTPGPLPWVSEMLLLVLLLALVRCSLLSGRSCSRGLRNDPVPGGSFFSSGDGSGVPTVCPARAPCLWSSVGFCCSYFFLISSCGTLMTLLTTVLVW